MSATVLVTGFEPFGSYTENPSAMLAAEYDGLDVGGRRVVSRVLPVAAATSGPALLAAIEEIEPEIVIALGLAGGRTRVAIERVAINVLDFPIPDNDGVQAVDLPVVPGGPTAYFSTLPVKAIASAWRTAGVPGYVSNTAGTYLCNAALYTALHAGTRLGFRAGFIHLPDLPQSAAARDEGGPSMALDTMRDAVRIAIATALAVDVDRPVPAGAIG